MSEFCTRPATLADLDAMLEAERHSWDELEYALSRKQLADFVTTFGEGTILVIDQKTGHIAAFSSTVRVVYNPEEPDTWIGMSGDGYISRTHVSDGPSLYGVNLSCQVDYRGTGASVMAMQAQMELAERLGIEHFYLGARIPGFAKWSRVFSLSDYISLRRHGTGIYLDQPKGIVFVADSSTARRCRTEGRSLSFDRKTFIHDPQRIREVRSSPHLDHELALFDRAVHAGFGFEVMSGLSEYFVDPDSLNCAALLVWRNPAFALATEALHAESA